ncbi:hypothetical protein BU23DRAFT_259903 [Bimuria novae-zelandiae CBS 107.79]|uniref:Uncharacterized protein n=1 Tax=Bimuria novae-zelandiae CBS 107.79 TaxID=1447943 RepID=A0A6A5UTV9_9PLEO|nr:hypothetical protein BU23DRAFT_259903 [Bimuria novae-zelandiae CBS 107.79]
MYSVHPVQSMSNGAIGNGLNMDPSGTINPAALNPADLVGGPQQVVTQQTSRGIKRSRTPEDSYAELQTGENGDDDSARRKRGRPGKPTKVSFSELDNHGSQPPQTPSYNAHAPPVQTPQLQATLLSQASPSQASPPAKSTPTKSTVIKALPTVRDHTTDQLNPEGDEYLPREKDEAGEQKVTPTGHPLGNREYRCRTFFVPNRGNKLFMLATECARVLGYRDSYLLFNKNRSLYKIIATQAEKDHLIHQEILPYSYRSRQIAIVTARSMFRQFGSRLIVNGRRVRDDYWESKARKQGFTEEDAAGEKRPGAARAREAAAAEASHAGGHLAFAHTGAYTGKLDQDYLGSTVNPLQPFGGLTPAPGAMSTPNSEPFEQRTTTDLQPRNYIGVQRPRHELSGAPYQDATRPSPSGEILNQASQTAEYNKNLGQQRKDRKQYLDDIWARPHEPPPPVERPGTADASSVPQQTQPAQSPHISSANAAVGVGQYGLSAQAPQRPGQPVGAQGYRPQPHPQSMVPSPMTQQHTPMRPDQMHRRPPSMNLPQGMNTAAMAQAGMLPNVGQPPGHGYPPQHMWQQAPPQPSPLSQQHNMQAYARPPQQSPHPQQSPMHASAQLHHAQSSGSMHGTPVQQYQTMNAMADPGFSAMGQNPYQPSPSPHQFMQHQSTAAQQPGMPGWAAPNQAPQQGWPTY